MDINTGSFDLMIGLFSFYADDVLEAEEKGFALEFYSHHVLLSRRVKEVKMPECPKAERCHDEISNLGDEAESLVKDCLSSKSSQMLYEIKHDIEKGRSFEDSRFSHEDLFNAEEKGFALGFNAYRRKIEPVFDTLMETLKDEIMNNSWQDSGLMLSEVLSVLADIGKIADSILNDALSKMSMR